MKTFFALVFAGLVSSTVLDKRACVADNCLRAVTGTGSLGKTSRPVLAMADCSIFMQKTITVTGTPAIATVYQTQTISTSTTSTILFVDTQVSTIVAAATITVANGLAGRDATPTVPTYASACSGPIRFSSACSCAGITAKTVTVSETAATPSVTISVTETSIISLLVSSTSTTTTLTTLTSTTTVSSSGRGPTCTLTSIFYDVKGPQGEDEPETYTLWYSGVGSEFINNDGRDGHGWLISIIVDTGDDCDAIRSCGQILADTTPHGHFDLHYWKPEQYWRCFTYFGPNNNLNDWYAGDVYSGPSYAFSAPVPPPGPEDPDERKL